jgi:cell division protein FtsB
MNDLDALYLKKLGKVIDLIHILSDFPLTRLDRLVLDVKEGLTQEESIKDQIAELRAALADIEAEIRNLNNI